MSLKIIPIDLFNNISTTYDQTKTSRIGKISNKPLGGTTAVGPPIVKYRNTVSLSETLTPNELHFTDSNRIFISTTELNGIVTIALYDINPDNNEISYVGKLNIQVIDSPATTHAIRGFRVDDTGGTTGWKIFWLSTANVIANAGLYMVNNVNLSDFNAVPITIPTATAPGQKAVYKLEDNPSQTLTSGTGISLDTINKHIYVHNGVAATHQYYKFDYGGTITTVLPNGITRDLILFKTGNLPPLSGTLLLTNSEEYHIPGIGPNTGIPCVIFNTTTFMYRGRLSDLSAGVTTWSSLEFQNNNPGTNLIVAESTARATFSDSLKRVILLTSNNVFIAKQFVDNTSDFYTVIEGRDNDEANVKEIYPFRVGAVQGIDSRNGMVAILSITSGQRGFYVANFDCNDIFDLTHIISPVLDVSAQRLLKVNLGAVRPDRASPARIYYRTSGFSSASGGWIEVDYNTYSFNGDIGIVSSTGQIQLKIGFEVFRNDKTNPLQLNSLSITSESLNSISDNFEYSQDDSSSGVPTRVAFRLKKQYESIVPTLTFRAYDLNDANLVTHDTVNNTSLFEYSVNDGVTWIQLGTIPNTVGTLVRYTFSTAPGVDIRPSIRES